MKQRYPMECNIAQTLNLVGDRWTMLVLHEVLIGRHTFNEMKKQLSGISANILSERLKHLETLGLVESELYTEHPPRFSYRPTEAGSAFSTVFDALLLWGRDHLDPCYKKLIHTECRTEVEMSYYCSCCSRRVDREELEPAVLEKEEAR
jgi:DNA-binding HxlR family transcriptional regulator